MAILEAKDIHKYFGDFHALKGVSIRVPANGILGLLGPNGAGKTTLIRTLTQITAPDRGEITFDGKPLKPDAIAQIGYLPEERGLYRKMRVWDQALYLCQIKGMTKEAATQSLLNWFERLEMQSWTQKKVEELSKGMQQKLQFAITVAPQPKLLILDEPFSGFDPVNTEAIKQQILALKNSGTSIVFSTHNMASVEELCQEISLIHRGENILSGNIQDIKQSFSKSMYTVRFKGSRVAFANALGHQFEIDHISELNEVSISGIVAHGKVDSNALLKALIQHVEIVSFEENLPSMHDIFIDLVSTKDQPNSMSYAVE